MGKIKVLVAVLFVTLFLSSCRIALAALSDAISDAIATDYYYRAGGQIGYQVYTGYNQYRQQVYYYNNPYYGGRVQYVNMRDCYRRR